MTGDHLAQGLTQFQLRRGKLPVISFENIGAVTRSVPTENIIRAGVRVEIR